jgi:glycosyltransferase involved in cell wall biosynthesis
VAEALRIAIRGARESFVPRARWILGTFADWLGREAVFVDPFETADIVYSLEAPRPARGVWIPLQPDAHEFFEGADVFPGPTTHGVGGLTFLFPIVDPTAPFPGDIVASAFYLMARWDELRVTEHDRFGRLPLAESAFAKIDGLDLEDPPVEGYLTRLREQLGIPAPAGWDVCLSHDIDRVRRRTMKGVAGMVKRRGPKAVLDVVGHDPWDNLVDVLESTAIRGLSSTVFLIGRNEHPLDGTPRRTYERERPRMAAAVRAARCEVGLHASFASAESGEALAEEMALLRGEAGEVVSVRYHYLRFRYHETVRWLEVAGAMYDSSLGFSEAPGFAAGCARPFHPYIVGEERPSTLELVPLAVMDTTLHSRLGLGPEEAREKTLSVLDTVRRVGGRVSLLWHNTYLDDDRAPGYGPLWGDLLDDLAVRGARMGPIGRVVAPEARRLEGRRIVHLTSVHSPRDVRIFHKEVTSLQEAGADASVIGPSRRGGRAGRVAAGMRLMKEARLRDADVYHVHDPELLPGALWLAKRTGRPVVYDVHEYLGQTARTKGWLPRPLRRPIALAAERVEQALAKRLAGTVAVNEDLAARFADAGARVVSVANYPRAATFPSTGPPEGPIVLYVGGLSPRRGLTLMLEAFPQVAVEGARLWLAGPGDPGDLPAGVEYLGVIDHSEVPGLLSRAAVAWVPLQRHGNYDRAVPTKLVEAMAAARPLVVSDLPRQAALVRASGCGLIVPPDDPGAHAAALTRLLSDPAAAKQMGDAGRAAFLEGMTFEGEARHLVALYDEILENLQ